MSWSLVSAVNDEGIFNSCLRHSPGAKSAAEVIIQKDFPSAAKAYNDAIRKAKTDLVVFAHQDVYLPREWFDSVQGFLDLLSTKNTNWGVLGVWGLNSAGAGAGFLYCTGAGAQLGKPAADISEVRALDEVVLILRKSSMLSFDEHLPGFHMYGTDICMAARRRGMKCYAISAFCIHNASGYRMLPAAFWKACFFIRKNWKSELPILAPCVKISYWCWPMARWNLVRAVNLIIGRDRPKIGRVPDPNQLYQQLLRSGTMGLPPSGEQQILDCNSKPATTNISCSP